MSIGISKDELSDDDLLRMKVNTEVFLNKCADLEVKSKVDKVDNDKTDIWHLVKHFPSKHK